MNLSNSRIPLAIALSSALAFSVGCNNRSVDDRAVQTPAAGSAPADPMMQTDPMTQGDARYGDATQGPVMGDAQRPGMDGDGRSSDQPVNDTWITTKVKSSLLADSDVAGLNIEVETINGVVMLSGQVAEQAQIQHATRIARGIEGVTDVRTTGLVRGTN